MNKKDERRVKSSCLISPVIISHTKYPYGSFPHGDNCLTCTYITGGHTSYIFYSTGAAKRDISLIV